MPEFLLLAQREGMTPATLPVVTWPEAFSNADCGAVAAAAIPGTAKVIAATVATAPAVSDARILICIPRFRETAGSASEQRKNLTFVTISEYSFTLSEDSQGAWATSAVPTRRLRDQPDP